MEHNCNYNKASMMVEFRRLLWRLDQYMKDAEKANHPLCKDVLAECKADLVKHTKKLEEAIVGLAKEDKFNFCENC